jgi:hypothetical protein
MPKIIKTFSYSLFLIIVSLSITNCNTILVSKYQTVKIKTDSEENEVYLDNEFLCKGKMSTIKINKATVKGDISIERKGYKTINDVILKTRRQDVFYPLLILGLPTLHFGLIYDLNVPKNKAFSKEIFVNSHSEESLLPFRKNDEKYLEVKNINFDINDISKDVLYIEVEHSDNLIPSLKESEKLYLKKQKTINQNKVKTLASKQDELKIKVEDIKYGEELFKILKQTNFIDTINNVFIDQNNTLVLEASIKKITHFIISSKWDRYWKTKLNITWFLKNTYNEILDSIDVEDYSGSYITYNKTIELIHYKYADEIQKNKSKYIGDALLNSYLNLTRKNIFTDRLKMNNDFSIKEDKLSINRVSNDLKVSNKTDAFKASVMIKAKEGNKFLGHGSGFAISQDGYILTNYHVIAGKNANKQNEISVITSNGQEYPATIVRFNKFRDVALLKIDFKFDKAFEIESTNKAQVMMDVLTIGAPKSIELGQSVSTGIISNIRNVNENNYLQLGMSINGGNSGGAIFDAQGNLHGIVVSKLVGYATEGVGFAIPSYLAADYLNLEIK